MFQLIDRRQLKADVKALLADAQVSPKAMVALYIGLSLLLNLLTSFSDTNGFLTTFINILTMLMNYLLTAGFILYCMAIRRGERAEFLTLFDGFSFVGKLIALHIVILALIWMWSLLFVIPGIIAAYRYRFALYNLYENPGIGVMEALEMSKRQTFGYKAQLFMLDLSYFGWALLATLPALVYNTYAELQLVSSMLPTDAAAAAIPEMSFVAAYPSWSWMIVIGLWQLVVSLFYLPNYQCVELGYFEIAKDTSGIGEGANPPQNPWHDGPDNMGGF